jgi:hypothetical protein
MLAIADMTEISAVLDRGSGLELAGLGELPCPTTTVGGRIKEGAL